MQNMDLKFDLFKLHVPEEDIKMKHSWIGVKSNTLLYNKLNKILDILLSNYPSQKELGIKLAGIFNCAAHSPLRHIIQITKRREHWVPLFFIETIAELYSKISNEDLSAIKQDLQKDFEFLRVGNGSSTTVNAIKELNKNLCKIAGAHAADGTIKEGYRIVIVDEYKSSVEAFGKSIEKSFGIKPKITKVKGKNAWQAIFRNKVIVRYLNQFFGFPKGKKFDKLDIPVIIKNAPLEFQKAFVCGAFTFDGSIRLAGSISFSSRSKTFRDSLLNIIQKIGISINSVVGSSHNKPMYVLRTSTKISKKDLYKWLNLFEPGTRKWFMIKELIYGYQISHNTFDGAIYQLKESLHHRIKKPVIQMIKLASQLNVFTTIELYQMVEYNIPFETFKSYFRLLKRCNIFIFKGRKKDGSVTYLYNEDIPSWRLPTRKQ